MLALPVIDVSTSLQGNQAERAAAASQLDDVCREHGFFYLTGHGVSPLLRQQVFEQARSFFSLPDDVKRRWHIERSGIQRGYDPVGWQSLNPGHPADLKESFYLGVDRGHQDPLVLAGVPNQGPNQWPSERLVPGFQAVTQAYANALDHLSRQVMSLMASALGLPSDYFDGVLRDPMPVLRLLHYPTPQGNLAKGQIGSGAHTDWGSLTLLAQDDVGGLQIQLNGNWVDVPFVHDSFVVNLGDLMARWTNDRWRSTLHRVLPPARDRYSVAYFFDIDYHTRVSALPGCYDGHHPPRYPPITAGEHIVERYRQTTLAAA